jgi:hypothetical protein
VKPHQEKNEIIELADALILEYDDDNDHYLTLENFIKIFSEEESTG